MGADAGASRLLAPADLQGDGRLFPALGFRYRGGGWIQTTGRNNYRRAAATLRDLGLEAPSARWVAERAGQPAYASLLAAAWWAPHFPANMSGPEWSVDRVTRIVNGGVNGLEERRRLTRRALEVRRGLASGRSSA